MALALALASALALAFFFVFGGIDFGFGIGIGFGTGIGFGLTVHKRDGRRVKVVIRLNHQERHAGTWPVNEKHLAHMVEDVEDGRRVVEVVAVAVGCRLCGSFQRLVNNLLFYLAQTFLRPGIFASQFFSSVPLRRPGGWLR